MCCSRACRISERKKEQGERNGWAGGDVKYPWHQRDEEIFIFEEERKEAVPVASLMKIASLWTVSENVSVIAFTAWQHAGGKSRPNSDTKRTLEREIALLGEKAFCAYNNENDIKNEWIIKTFISCCARKMKDSEDKRAVFVHVRNFFRWTVYLWTLLLITKRVYNDRDRLDINRAI